MPSIESLSPEEAGELLKILNELEKNQYFSPIGGHQVAAKRISWKGLAQNSSREEFQTFYEKVNQLVYFEIVKVLETRSFDYSWEQCTVGFGKIPTVIVVDHSAKPKLEIQRKLNELSPIVEAIKDDFPKKVSEWFYRLVVLVVGAVGAAVGYFVRGLDIF